MHERCMKATGVPMRIVVCVPTHNRPEQLVSCLESIARQTLSKPAIARIEVLVADNSADGDAVRYVDGIRNAFPHLISAIHVESRGLCHARNALFVEARDRADFLALIDDDEKALDGWLQHLLGAALRYDADAVIGPVLPSYEDDVPDWYLRARMDHAHPKLLRLGTGARSPKRAAHNTLINVRVIEAVPYPWFPLELNFAGSEDRAFFDRARLHRVGEVVWCAEAKVEEFVPSARTTWRFFVKRCLQRGTSEVCAEKLLRRDYGDEAPGAVLSASRTFAVFCKAALMAPLLPFPQFRHRAIKTFLYGVGRVSGHLGGLQELYK